MTHCLEKKTIRKILLQVNSSYFSKMVLHNSINKTRASECLDNCPRGKLSPI